MSYRSLLPLVLCTTFIFTACVGPGKLATESGKPEVSISNLTTAEVAAKIRTWAPTKGQIVTSADASVITTSSSVEVPIGIGMEQSVGARTVYNVVASGSGVKVYSMRFIAASRDPYGYYKPLGVSSVLTNEYNSQEAYEQMQEELRDLVAFLARN